MAPREELASRNELATEVPFRLEPLEPPTPFASELRQGPGNSADGEETPLQLPLEGLSLEEASVVESPMLAYLRMVASLIEGRTVGRKELVEALQASMRQRSLALRSRTEYVLHFLHQHPP